jgi:hypothetical protein
MTFMFYFNNLINPQSVPPLSFGQALVKGVIALESHRLYPNVVCARPRLFASTENFLNSFRLHRRRILYGHDESTCPSCQGWVRLYLSTGNFMCAHHIPWNTRVLAVQAYTMRQLAQAQARFDDKSAHVMTNVLETLRLACIPAETINTSVVESTRWLW